MITRMYTLLAFITMCQLVSSQPSESVHRLVGESITLNCNPSSNINNDYPISWYRQDRQIFINNGDEGRFSAECSREFFTDSCFLTISPLTTDDEDTYACVYYNGISNVVIDSMNLMVGYGQLPSDDSPVCEIYKIASDRQYILSDSHQMFTIGDEIYLRCVDFDSDFTPSFSWIREQGNITTTLTPYVTGHYLFQSLNLTNIDVGANFVCVMRHPALSETRSCLIKPLPILQSTSRKPASQDSYDVTPTNQPMSTQISIKSEEQGESHTQQTLIFRTPTHQPVSPETTITSEEQGQSPMQQTFMLLIIIIATLVILVVVSVTIIMLLLVKRKRKNNQNMLSNKPVERNDATNGPSTTNYTELNLSEIKQTPYKEMHTSSVNTSNSFDQDYESPIFAEDQTTNYTELNQSNIKPSTYEELKAPSMNAVEQEYESPNFADEQTTSVIDCYEVAAVSDHLEQLSGDRNQGTKMTSSSIYENL